MALVLLPTKYIPESQSQADSTTLCTSLPSIPPSALYEMQGSVPGLPASTHHKSKGLAPKTCAAQYPPLTPHLKSVPHTPQDPDPAPCNTQGPTPSVHGVSQVSSIQSMAKKARANGRYIIGLQNSYLTPFIKQVLKCHH